MKVTLTLQVEIDTEKLDSEVRVDAEQQTVWSGFPISEENTAWYVVEGFVLDELSGISGVKAELCP